MMACAHQIEWESRFIWSVWQGVVWGRERRQEEDSEGGEYKKERERKEGRIGYERSELGRLKGERKNRICAREVLKSS